MNRYRPRRFCSSRNRITSAIYRYAFLPVGMAMLICAASAQQPETNGSAAESDVIARLQKAAIATKTEKSKRPWHFGSQGRMDVYSNHTSHSNRLIPAYTFGSKIRLSDVSGKNSLYRDPQKIKDLYGYDAPNTHNPEAEYFDQTDLYRLQKKAVEQGVKYLFVVWFDGLDYETTQAAAAAKSGAIYTAGKGDGLIFQDYRADGTANYGYCVTSPSHNSPTKTNVDSQTIEFSSDVLRGGYDPEIAGETPWSPGPLSSKAPGYLKGQAGNVADKSGVSASGRNLHAYTDSSTSAASAFNGIKSFNNGLNVDPEGKPANILWHDLQKRGWKLGTVTSVPFNHASPAATYARNVYRDDYQDIAREMLGMVSVFEETYRSEHFPGLDVILGAGASKEAPRFEHVKDQGQNSADGTAYLANADKKSARIENGGKYVVVERTSGKSGKSILAEAAERAAEGDHRLFGIFGTQYGNLPFRTTNADYEPAPGIRGTQKYTDADLLENPTLADMTRAALTVLAKDQGRPFSLFVEAGDVDFALHDNNLDSAIGAVLSGEEAIRAIIAWVEKNSDWNESAMIVTADHGHYLVIDDVNALAGHAKGVTDKRETP